MAEQGLILGGEGKRVLIVGAGGFVGGFLVEEGLRRGYEVWAGVRSSTSRRWLTDERIRFVEFEFDNPTQVIKSMEDALPYARWDYIIYNLGATKVMRYADFNRINYEYLKTFTGALHHTGKVPEKLLYISSLSAVGPCMEQGGEISEDVVPRPDTKYGASKLKSELWLATAGIPYIIFRPTGIYGPRDRDYYLMFKSVKSGFDFAAGFKRQMLTFIFVEDLVEAAYEALLKAPTGEIYNISESRAYSQKEYRHLTKKSLGKRFVLPVRVPLWGLKLVSTICELWGVARMKAMTLNKDKYKIMRQRNWNCDVRKAESKFGFKARTALSEGLIQTAEWYKKEGWL